MVQHWRRIEELGFDSVWLADHFVNPYQTNQSWFEAWTLLAALAAQTSRIRVGTLVTPFPLRNPAVLARQALTLDHIANGRLELGLGSGVQGDPSYRMTGLPDYEAPERVARFREVVELVDSLLRNETTSYQGRYYTADEAIMNPRPLQQPRPPLTIAALGPAMLKIAARYADRLSTYPRVSPDQAGQTIRERNQLLDQYCAEIGRDPGEISRSLLVFGATSRTAPLSSPGAFEDFVGSYREIGIDEFIFYYPPSEFYSDAGPDQDAVLERVAGAVIPGLRQSSAHT